MKNHVQTMTFAAVLMFLCCYFMQIFNMPNVIVVGIGAILCLVMLIQQKRFRIDIGICLLAVTMISYYVIVNGMRGAFFVVLYIPLILYEMGNYSVWAIKKDDKKLRMLIGAFVLGFAIHGILNAYMYYAGYVIPGTRQWADFWHRGSGPGTQHTSYFLPVFALAFPAVAYFMKRKWSGFVILAMTAFFGYTSLATKSRMAVLIFALVCCVQVVIYIMTEQEKVKKLVTDKRFWMIVAALIIAVIGAFFVVKDSAVVAAFIDNMSKGGGILNNVRFEAQRLALEQLFDHPMGGRLMDLGRTYCHNTWLDMANAAGLIPFFAFAGYTVYTACETIRLVLSKEIVPETKMIIAGLYVAFFLYMSVEPALDASIHLVTPWIFVNGLIHGCLSKERRA